MNVGRMDRVVVIQTSTDSQDTDLSDTKSWSTFLTIWAERRDLNMRERLQAGQVDANITARFFSLYDQTITEKMRLVDGSQTYEILGVREIGMKEGLELFVGTV